MAQRPVAIMEQPRRITLHGYGTAHQSGTARGAEFMELLQRVWVEVRAKDLAHGGISHAVYDCGDVVFAGVELLAPAATPTSLVKKDVVFTRYAHWKHIGPYHGLPKAYEAMEAAIRGLGLSRTCPSMEIYGHWTADESRLETEIFISVT
jgi:effector-binding domain-containing protein